MTTTIYVCTTCKNAGDTAPERAGARLYKTLIDARDENDLPFKIEGVECLSVCKRPCTIAFHAKDKWTYVYGDFSAEDSADMIFAAASLYEATADGLIPWKERPDALKKGVVARLPPSLSSSSSSESAA